MTPRERMMTAMGHGLPDRVPVCPDFSYMIPCRLTGKPFMRFYAENDPPLWRTYLDAVRYYGTDGWFWYAGPAFRTSAVTEDTRWLEQNDERWIQEKIIHTPQGDLSEVLLCARGNPPALIEKLIKNPQEDLPKLYALWQFDSVDTSEFERQRAEIGEAGIVGPCLCTPGFHMWDTMFEGGVATLSYLLMDAPQLLDALYEQHLQRVLSELPHHLACRPDMILTGGSGSITMASPTLWRKFGLPALREITRQAKAHGILTMVHSCGKEQYLAEVCANETDLDCVNPLEIPPMGDCHLRDLKARFGDKLCLMGNLHTTDVMLRGSIAEVKAAARQAIDDAAAGGGFILSTGDQCGRDTPDENIFALVEVAEEYGRYS